MTIKKLKRFPLDPAPQPKTPRCEADISDFSEHERRWRANRYPASAEKRPFQCSRDSVVEISGVHYCRLHGGHKALDMVLSGELIEKKEAAETSTEDNGRDDVSYGWNSPAKGDTKDDY